MWRSRLAWVYLFLVGLTWGLGTWVGERTVPTLLLAYAPPLVWLLPSPVVLVWTLLRRRGIAVALAGLLLATFGAGFQVRRQSEGALRVVTFNLARGTLGTPEQAAAILRASQPDVILLQETNFVPAGYGAALLRLLPGYQFTAGHEVLTLTRLPLLSSREDAIPGSRRTVLETTLRWRGQPLTVVNAHLNTVLVSSAATGNWDAVRGTNRARVWQVGLLCRLASGGSGRVLVGGDLNTPPRGMLYRRLRNCIGPDAHEAAGRGPGWTFPRLFLRIDHLFARGLTPTRSHVLPHAGSDHRPLLAEYR